MAELADAHGSGPCGSNTMRVQVSFPARQKSVKYKLSTLFSLSGIMEKYLRREAGLGVYL